MSFGFSELINLFKNIRKKVIPPAELVDSVNDNPILHDSCKRETVSCR